MNYSLKELAKKLDISPESLSGWVEKDLIVQNAPGNEFFNDAALKEGEVIKKFLAMGYSLSEIAKIRKEIGLPVKGSLKTTGVIGAFLTVGELAEKGGVNTRTIKFWEEKGLIHPAQRSDGGFRLFTARDVDLVKVIKDLQTFNYTLSEIGNILKLIGSDVESETELTGIKSSDLEKIQAALEYLIERMRETRQASTRIEALFARRLKVVSRIFRAGKNE